MRSSHNDERMQQLRVYEANSHKILAFRRSAKTLTLYRVTSDSSDIIHQYNYLHKEQAQIKSKISVQLSIDEKIP